VPVSLQHCVESTVILVVDVGGTKTLCAIDRDGALHARHRYENDAYPNWQALLDDYCAQLPATTRSELRAACFAVAGPVAAGTARLTNRGHWTLTEENLRAHLDLPVTLVNDFVASASALPTLTSDELVTLQAGVDTAHAAPRLCLGPGTGLGVAAVNHGKVIASEAGHIGFAPTDGQQADLWRFLGGEHRRVTAERVCSGPGLLACYRYSLVRSGHPLPQDIAPADIVARAHEQHDADAQHALALFVKLLGSVTGDLALAFMASGGVFLTGGIPPKILPYLVSGEFIAAFSDKAEHAKLMQTFPVHVVLCDELALRGAAILGRAASVPR
jgi:glucokinase